MASNLEYVLQVLDRARTERVSEAELLMAMQIVKNIKNAQPLCKPPNPLTFPTLSLAG